MTDPRETYLDQAEHVAAAGPAFVRALRRRAVEDFLLTGFPTSRDEDWRYTPLQPLLANRFRLADREAPDAPPGLDALLGPARGLRCVFVDGRPLRSRWAEDAGIGVDVHPLDEALLAWGDWLEPHLASAGLLARGAFLSLNTAFTADGALVTLAPAAATAGPIELVFVSTGTKERPTMTHPRILVLAGQGARASVIERFVGPPGSVYLTNSVAQLFLAEGAAVDYLRLQEESSSAFHVSRVEAKQSAESQLSCRSFSLGGAWARSEVHALLDAEGCSCTLDGLFLATGWQHSDQQTFIDHASPRCQSRELYKGVLDGHGRGVFRGRVLVREAAQKTAASQENKNLLLSDEAEIETLPQLAIHADDVKCSHGAAVGQLEAEALFYLRSRGIDRELARGLLTHAFVQELVDHVPDPSVRADLDARVRARLPAGAALEEVWP